MVRGGLAALPPHHLQPQHLPGVSLLGLPPLRLLYPHPPLAPAHRPPPPPLGPGPGRVRRLPAADGALSAGRLPRRPVRHQPRLHAHLLHAAGAPGVLALTWARRVPARPLSGASTLLRSAGPACALPTVVDPRGRGRGGARLPRPPPLPPPPLRLLPGYPLPGRANALQPLAQRTWALRRGAFDLVRGADAPASVDRLALGRHGAGGALQRHLW